jgi:hypothetical protein
VVKRGLIRGFKAGELKLSLGIFILEAGWRGLVWAVGFGGDTVGLAAREEE